MINCYNLRNDFSSAKSICKIFPRFESTRSQFENWNLYSYEVMCSAVWYQGIHLCYHIRSNSIDDRIGILQYRTIYKKNKKFNLQPGVLYDLQYGGTVEISPCFGPTVWGQIRNHIMIHHRKYLKLICMWWSWVIEY